MLQTKSYFFVFMSSSYRLRKRINEKDPQTGKSIWNFGGDFDSHYIRPNGECHPSFLAVPIGNMDGPKVCIPRVGYGGKTLDQIQSGPCKSVNSSDVIKTQPEHMSKYNGYHKYSADLYDYNRKTPVQDFNPQDYSQRRIPNEEWYLQHDYLRLPIGYNGTGLSPTATPGDQRFFEYGVDYMGGPPLKYDVHRLHQLYPIWKKRHQYHGNNTVSNLDNRHYGAYV